MKKFSFKRGFSILLAFLMIFSLLGLYSNAENERLLRVNYVGESKAEELGLWLWGDVLEPSEQKGAWPDGREKFPSENISDKKAYVDIPIKPDAAEIGLLVIDSKGNKITGEDVTAKLDSNVKEIFVNDKGGVSYEDLSQIPEGTIRIRYFTKDGNYDNLGVWVWEDVETPSEKLGAWPNGASPLQKADDMLGGAYVDIKLKADAKKLGFLFVNTKSSEQTEDYSLDIKEGVKAVYMYEGDSDIHFSPLRGEKKKEENKGLKFMELDEKYYADEELGVSINSDGNYVFRLWAPTAQEVRLVLYAKDESVIKSGLPLHKKENGVWELIAKPSVFNYENFEGLYYNYKVKRDDVTKLVLDPYAKSMAPWSSDKQEVPKGAIVNALNYGEVKSFANIEGFEEKEDAIIYEAHIRDFTSDPSIEKELKNPFGTFSAFAEKLDYLKELGVTHIQLLPVMSYYFVDEMNRERSLEYSSSKENYNWGYDPLSYFSLSGMYSNDPKNAALRIEELKKLVSLIHEKGMGVIFDVVYNHTATMSLFEDIEPNYYFFSDKNGNPKGSFGGGQFASTHLMARKLIIDSLTYFTENFKADGFRFDMMGNLDAETIALAYEKVSKINPKTLWVGEGWRTYNGDHGVTGVIPADQSWMDRTNAVAVFSDELRNELKSGFGCEGEPRFITGGKRMIKTLFDNIKAKPSNISADDPGDVLQYVAAHDNLPLHDVIALSIKKDPADFEHEILRRQRLANAYLLTHQGTIFIHSGQEYGRTKQFLHPKYESKLETAPEKSTLFSSADGKPFKYPYFIHDSYDSSDAVNMFAWHKLSPGSENEKLMSHTKGMIALRRSTDAFSYGDYERIEKNVSLIESPSIEKVDLAIAYKCHSEKEGCDYLVFANADEKEREFDISALRLKKDSIELLVDADQAGTQKIDKSESVEFVEENGLIKSIKLQPLMLCVVRSK